jgi:hypothetical protein
MATLTIALLKPWRMGSKSTGRIGSAGSFTLASIVCSPMLS